MHSSRMRTVRCSGRRVMGEGERVPRGSVSAQGECVCPGGCLCRGCLPRGCMPKGVSAQGGICPGVYMPGGVYPGGCLPRVVSAQGVATQGRCLPRGVCIPACTGADTPSPVERILDTHF